MDGLAIDGEKFRFKKGVTIGEKVVKSEIKMKEM